MYTLPLSPKTTSEPFSTLYYCRSIRRISKSTWTLHTKAFDLTLTVRKYILFIMPIFTLHLWVLTLTPTWYWLMYALSFLCFFFIVSQQKISEKEKDMLIFYTILSVIIGGRMGYVLLYNFSYYIQHPWDILMLWRGGMSFHGWALWVILAWYLAARKIGMSFLKLSDTYVWIVPLWLFLGRVGNYINGELFGIPGYTGFWAHVIDGIPYFPTPLLEALLEGIILWWILYWKKNNIQYPGQLGVWFLGWYGVFRFLVEFFRTPDPQIGYIIGNWMTMGHLLSACMILASMILSYFLWKEIINQKNPPKSAIISIR